MVLFKKDIKKDR